MTTTPTITDLDRPATVWDPPGPGTWEFDAAHQQRPYPAAMLEWAPQAVEDGFRAGFALVGVPLDTMAVRSVHGWIYMHAVPLGAPDTGGAPPPKFVLSVLFRLIPSLRRRHAVARSVFVDRPWNELVRAWQSTGRQQALARQRALADDDLQAFDDARLAARLTAVRDAAADAYRVHFIHAAPAAAVTGRFATLTHELTGLPIDAAFEMMSGFSAATTEPFELLDEVVAALPPDLDLRQDAETVLAAIDGIGGAAAAALAEYLHRYGDTIVAGESPLDPTLRELPGVIVASLRARRNPSQDRTRDHTAEQTAAARALVPQDRRAEWDQLLEDAQRVTALRDDDVGVALRLVGRLRLVLLEAGRRLHDRGVLDHAESVFDIAGDEIADLLTGRATTTDADRHRADRLAAAAASPPAVLGPPEDPPDFAIFPQAVRIVSEGLFAYISRLDAPPADHTADALTGTGIGIEPATGRARIVVDIEDLDRVEAADILVTPMTTPVYNATIAGCLALVCDHGGAASHAAIMAREFGIPAVVGTHTATMDLVDGELITVDPRSGTVSRPG